jgi:hypothetical protein
VEIDDLAVGRLDRDDVVGELALLFHELECGDSIGHDRCLGKEG